MATTKSTEQYVGDAVGNIVGGFASGGIAGAAMGIVDTGIGIITDIMQADKLRAEERVTKASGVASTFNDYLTQTSKPASGAYPARAMGGALPPINVINDGNSGKTDQVPVDAAGTPVAKSGRPIVALTDNGEVIINGYVFSDDLGFAKEAQKLLKKFGYNKETGELLRPNDGKMREAFMQQVSQLQSDQEQLRKAVIPTDINPETSELEFGIDPSAQGTIEEVAGRRGIPAKALGGLLLEKEKKVYKEKKEYSRTEDSERKKWREINKTNKRGLPEPESPTIEKGGKIINGPLADIILSPTGDPNASYPVMSPKLLERATPGTMPVKRAGGGFLEEPETAGTMIKTDPNKIPVSQLFPALRGVNLNLGDFIQRMNAQSGLPMMTSGVSEPGAVNITPDPIVFPTPATGRSMSPESVEFPADLRAFGQTIDQSRLGAATGVTPGVMNEKQYIIQHHTASNDIGSVDAMFTKANPDVSSQYVIDTDGTVKQYVGDDQRAWHAGESSWLNDQGVRDMDMNTKGIGIEVVNPGDTDFTPEQRQNLIMLNRYLMEQYGIEPGNVLSHQDVRTDYIQNVSSTKADGTPVQTKIDIAPAEMQRLMEGINAYQPGAPAGTVGGGRTPQAPDPSWSPEEQKRFEEATTLRPGEIVLGDDQIKVLQEDFGWDVKKDPYWGTRLSPEEAQAIFGISKEQWDSYPEKVKQSMINWYANRGETHYKDETKGPNGETIVPGGGGAEDKVESVSTYNSKREERQALRDAKKAARAAKKGETTEATTTTDESDTSDVTKGMGWRNAAGLIAPAANILRGIFEPIDTLNLSANIVGRIEAPKYDPTQELSNVRTQGAEVRNAIGRKSAAAAVASQTATQEAISNVYGRKANQDATWDFQAKMVNADIEKFNAQNIMSVQAAKEESRIMAEAAKSNMITEGIAQFADWIQGTNDNAITKRAMDIMDQNNKNVLKAIDQRIAGYGAAFAGDGTETSAAEDLGVDDISALDNPPTIPDGSTPGAGPLETPAEGVDLTDPTVTEPTPGTTGTGDNPYGKERSDIISDIAAPAAQAGGGATTAVKSSTTTTTTTTETPAATTKEAAPTVPAVDEPATPATGGRKAGGWADKAFGKRSTYWVKDKTTGEMVEKEMPGAGKGVKGASKGVWQGIKNMGQAAASTESSSVPIDFISAGIQSAAQGVKWLFSGKEGKQEMEDLWNYGGKMDEMYYGFGGFENAESSQQWYDSMLKEFDKIDQGKSTYKSYEEFIDAQYKAYKELEERSGGRRPSGPGSFHIQGA